MSGLYLLLPTLLVVFVSFLVIRAAEKGEVSGALGFFRDGIHHKGSGICHQPSQEEEDCHVVDDTR